MEIVYINMKRKRNYKMDLNDEINRIEQSLNNLENLSDEIIEKKNKDIIEKIYYYIELTDKIEERRERIQNFSYQYLAILITALGILLTIKSEIPLLEFYFFIFTILIQIFFSYFIIFKFVRQSIYNYPFLKIKEFSNQWKWFYYGNEYIQKIKTKHNFLSKNTKTNSISNYLKGLDFFINKYIEEDLKTEIKSNIIQLYLLQVHNYYKNKFYLQLSKVRIYSFSVFIFCIFIYFMLKIFYF